MTDVSPELNLPPPKRDQIRNGKNADKSVKGRLKRGVGKVILGTPLAALLISSGNIDNPHVSGLNIKDPTPASFPLPENIIHKTEEELIPYSPSITIVDAAPSEPTKGLIQNEFISNEKMMIDMLGDQYISTDQLTQEFGSNYEDKWDEVVAKYPQAPAYRLVDAYFSHGENVARVAEDTLESSGLQSTGINILPLQKIFDKDSITFIKDASGNPGVSLNFDSERIIELLRDDPSRVVNGSFQVGNVELFQKTTKRTDEVAKFIDFEGNIHSIANANDWNNVSSRDAQGNEIQLKLLEGPKTYEVKATSVVIDGAYTKEKAMENLPKLFEVCNAYPDKFFVFAVGNSGEDLREAMDALKNKAPKNLLIVAEWIKYNHSMGAYEGPAMEYGKYGQVLGPDIYVYNEGSNHPHGSSFSVPEISAEIEALLKKRLSFQQAKEKILASSDSRILHLADGTQYTARVFNPSKIREK